ncbi:MAG: DUF2157 domain-containing protein [Bacteroidia bacterium]
MSKPLEKELEVLEKEGIISAEIAANIRNYYKSKSENPHNRLFTVFAVLGAILVGLGIILIIAHNWDDLSKATKVFFSFLPLIIGQAFCAFTLLKKSDNAGWKEGSSVFLFFGVGASISLVSQVYNIHGDLSDFLFTWMLLCLPLTYLMKSSTTSLLYIAGITYYAVESHTYWSLFNHNYTFSYNYWWMLTLAIPFYYNLYKEKGDSNAMVMHNWIVPLSLIFALGTMSSGHGNLLYIGYMSMFGMFFLIGSSDYFQNVRRRVNGYLVLGALGTMQILLMASFHWFWEELQRPDRSNSSIWGAPEFFLTVVFSATALLLFISQTKKNGMEDFHPTKIFFLVFILLYLLGQNLSTLPIILVNIVILTNGIFTIRSGVKHDHLGILNYGLLTITALIVCRFFDSNMSFIVRGLLFIAVGVGFFLGNYLMLKKRKTVDNEK